MNPFVEISWLHIQHREMVKNALRQPHDHTFQIAAAVLQMKLVTAEALYWWKTRIPHANNDL